MTQKAASVSPTDKGLGNKKTWNSHQNKTSPVSWKSAFLFSTYRESYNTEHIIRLLEEWRKNLDNFLEGGVYMDISKAFDCRPHDLLIANLAVNGFKGTA